MKVLVTGGAGFIGSAVIRLLRDQSLAEVVNVDALTYAGNLESLPGLTANHPDETGYAFEHVDITDRAALSAVFARHRPDAVMHLAAESHVDRSILGPDVFIETNVRGTGVLLEVARDYWQSLDQRGGENSPQARFRFHHISTDEVFGDLPLESPAFVESTPYAPSSPYAASKAASDHLVRAWYRTYGLPVVVTNCSNNYGPYQFPEKLIPLMILNALAGHGLPVYGDGEQRRDWLHVEDHARALWRVLQQGEVGRTYNIGGDAERSNYEVVSAVCDALAALKPLPGNARYHDQIEFVTDRPGHDRRYAMNSQRIQSELGWMPLYRFEQGLEATVAWYLSHPEWVARVQSGAYRDWLTQNYQQR